MIEIELKRYVAAQETGYILVNLYRKPDSSKRKSYPSNDWKEHQNLSNTQLEHLQLMKGTIVDVTTVIKTTGVRNANNLLI